MKPSLSLSAARKKSSSSHCEKWEWCLPWYFMWISPKKFIINTYKPERSAQYGSKPWSYLRSASCEFPNSYIHHLQDWLNNRGSHHLARTIDQSHPREICEKQSYTINPWHLPSFRKRLRNLHSPKDGAQEAEDNYSRRLHVGGRFCYQNKNNYASSTMPVFFYTVQYLMVECKKNIT